MAVLGDQPDPSITHRSGPPGRHGDAAHLDSSRVEGEQAAEDIGELGLAVALDAGDADDLAGVHVEGQVVENGPTVERTPRRR